MIIQVMKINGTSHMFDVTPNTKIYKVKEMVTEKENEALPPGSYKQRRVGTIRLLFHGSTLEDDRTLSSYNISPEDNVLHCVFTMRDPLLRNIERQRPTIGEPNNNGIFELGEPIRLPIGNIGSRSGDPRGGRRTRRRRSSRSSRKTRRH
jgi:hypothetical protein